MTEVPAVAQDQNDQNDTNETNDLPVLKVDASKLPTVPTELPPVVEQYGKDGGTRGRLQIQHLKQYLDVLSKYGKQLLSQHNAEGAAEQTLEEAAEYADVRAERERIEDLIETKEKELAQLEVDLENYVSSKIAEIVAKTNEDSDIDYEVAEFEYSSALTNLTNTYKSFEAAGTAVQSAVKAFAKEIPQAKDLINGTKKTRKSNSTMPGKGDDTAGWRPRFDWLSIDGKVIEGVTSIGALAKHFDNGKRYEQILGRLEDAVVKQNGSRTNIADDQEYTWTVEVQNLDDNTTKTTEFKGLAVSRATANARANASQASASEPVVSEPVVSEAIAPDSTNAAEDF